MKNATRLYIRILVANALLIGVVMALWQYRLHGPGFAPSFAPAASAPISPALSGADAGPSAAGGAILPINPPLPLPPATFLRDLDHDDDLAGLRGPALVNLWATWCPPCLKEMPTLQKLKDLYKDKNLQVIAISLDEVKSLDAFRARTARLNVGPVAQNWDRDGRVYAALNPVGMPMTYLLDAQGRVVARVIGERDWTDAESRAAIDRLLRASGLR
ncbi:MAG: TlpA family protein disulfide reductase [Alphaproteobacteria bacterium]|nr:TlpA family protein disulfide reductase [Alphaproteobacteria bacterium]USO07496.1 MAG: TlpA family protein disulfide reductase [Rhodospirillales bacterium]